MNERNLPQTSGTTGTPFVPTLWEHPFGLLRRFTTDMERFFDEFAGTRFLTGESRLLRDADWIPNVDVVEKDGSLSIRADLPGLTKNDVHVDVTAEMITIQGERKKDFEEERGGVYRHERSYGSFYRSFPLPEGVKPEQVKATFDNGVLHVTMPAPAAKLEAKARRIEIQDASSEKKIKPAA